jgi:prepilin-type N-terminal cleavage/methylation domain-containing protein
MVEMREFFMRRTGLTLIELMVVILIIALIAALVLPVLFTSRRRSQEAVCISQLRQIHSAYALYLQDYGQPAPGFSDLMPYIRDRRVVRCPVDHYKLGAAYMFSGRRVGQEVETSYYYFLPFAEDWLSVLESKDANHGIAVCVLHGQPKTPDLEGPAQLVYQGKVLRLRKDGSVKAVQVEFLCYREDGGISEMRHPWLLYTDIRPIPREVLETDPTLRNAEIVPCP